MKQIIILLVIFGTTVSTAFGQIKKEFKDPKSGKTTVVVKEDGADDYDLLNSHFNLDDYGVAEQIRITTDQVAALNAPPVAEPESESVLPASQDLTLAANTNEGFQKPKTRMKRWSVREKKPATTTSVATTEAARETAVTPQTPPVSAKTTISTSSRVSKGSTRNKKSITKTKRKTQKVKRKTRKVKRKKRTRRVKNKNRKKFNRKKFGCYKF